MRQIVYAMRFIGQATPVGPDGNVYVLDPFNSRVQVFTPDGTFLREWGEAGAGPGQLTTPEGIAVDGAGAT